MARRGANQPSVGGYNEAVVLDQIRRAHGHSRVELADATGLSAQTVSNIVQRLLDAGIVEEAGRTSSGRGKPRTTLRLVGSSRYAVGVHLDPGLITVVVLSIDGEVVARHARATPRAQDPADTVAVLIEDIQAVLSESGIDRSRIVGLGIAAPGPIDADRGIVVDPPNLLGWDRVPLRDAIAEATGLAVVLDKDVTAAAVAEKWVAAPGGAPNFAFLYLGTGLGVGLVVGDEVVRGGSGNAGEIGHIVVDPEGPSCACGLRGCIAVTCAPLPLVEEAERRGVLEADRECDDPTRVDAALTRLVRMAEDGDERARDLLQRCTVHVARALAVVSNLLDVDRIVMGGPLWDRVGPTFTEAIPPLLDEMRVARGVHPLSIAGTALGSDVGAIGAACLILDEALTPRPTSLLVPTA
ncbi:ROK family transcriptional regulator [Microbacterium oleivorans]|uniref:Transcriptional regulator n=1 Tax=Microbacterium oleivorans TaxID=273677 RepID=A0A177K8R1_9MICO|nr:ROK family transcriptional regulator [Microbacterium oleivorans]OAH49780.1 transcriptional regulator [Microbacterium oleivorans]